MLLFDLPVGRALRIPTLR